MNHFENLGNQFSVPIKPDKDGASRAPPRVSFRISTSKFAVNEPSIRQL